MKKILVAVALMASVALAGCADSRVINGKQYQPYGIANTDTRDPNIVYRPNFWSVVLSVVFIETIVVPVYIVGWDLFEPIGPVPQDTPKS